MRKKKPKDYRPFKEKFRDFMYHKPWKVILYSFIVAVVIFVVGWLTKNEAGLAVILIYLATTIDYVFTLIEEKRFSKSDGPHAHPFMGFCAIWGVYLFLLLVSYLNR